MIEVPSPGKDKNGQPVNHQLLTDWQTAASQLRQHYYSLQRAQTETERFTPEQLTLFKSWQRIIIERLAELDQEWTDRKVVSSAVLLNSQLSRLDHLNQHVESIISLLDGNEL